jgi:hypothetical protein
VNRPKAEPIKRFRRADSGSTIGHTCHAIRILDEWTLDTSPAIQIKCEW